MRHTESLTHKKKRREERAEGVARRRKGRWLIRHKTCGCLEQLEQRITQRCCSSKHVSVERAPPGRRARAARMPSPTNREPGQMGHPGVTRQRPFQAEQQQHRPNNLGAAGWSHFPARSSHCSQEKFFLEVRKRTARTQTADGAERCAGTVLHCIQTKDTLPAVDPCAGTPSTVQSSRTARQPFPRTHRVPRAPAITVSTTAFSLLSSQLRFSTGLQTRNPTSAASDDRSREVSGP